MNVVNAADKQQIALVHALLNSKLGAFKQTTPKSHRIYFNAIAGVALNRFRTS